MEGRKVQLVSSGIRHIPNAETIASIEESENGKGVKSFDSMDDLYKDLGI